MIRDCLTLTVIVELAGVGAGEVNDTAEGTWILPVPWCVCVMLSTVTFLPGK